MVISIIINVVLWAIISFWCYFMELDEWEGFKLNKVLISLFSPLIVLLISVSFFIFMLCIRLFGDIDDKTDLL